MPVLKLLVDKTMKEKKFFEMIKLKTSVVDMVKNPFNTDIKLISDGSKMIVLMDIEPIYPDLIPKVGLFLAGVSFIFSWRVTMIMGLILTSTWFFWTDRFFFLVLKRARKKHKLDGEIRILKNKETLRGVMRLWDR